MRYLNPVQVITNGVMTATITQLNTTAQAPVGATATLSPLRPIHQFTMFAYQATWSGTSPVGTLSLQATIDGTDWVTIPNSSQAVATNTGNVIWTYANAVVDQVRLVYTFVSGTGTLQAWFCAKGVE